MLDIEKIIDDTNYFKEAIEIVNCLDTNFEKVMQQLHKLKEDNFERFIELLCYNEHPHNNFFLCVLYKTLEMKEISKSMTLIADSKTLNAICKKTPDCLALLFLHFIEDADTNGDKETLDKIQSIFIKIDNYQELRFKLAPITISHRLYIAQNSK